MNQENKRKVSIAINAAIFVWTAICILHFFTGSGDGNMEVTGAVCFRFFTIDSNILAAVCALFVLIFQIRALKTGAETLPEWVLVLKMTGTVAVMLTFLTVVFFLGPTQGYVKMFEGDNTYMHAIGPVFALVSFCCLEKGLIAKQEHYMIGCIPALIYAIVYMVMVIVVTPANGGWEDFYGFNRGELWFITLPAMMLFNWLIGAGTGKLHNRIAEKEN